MGLMAGAAPPVAVLEGAESIGIKLTHVYGLTEVYGPASVCAEQPGWDDLPADQRAQRKRRQGVPYPLQEAVTVLDPETMREDRKSTRLNSSHLVISYAVFCLKKKKQ